MRTKYLHHQLIKKAKTNFINQRYNHFALLFCKDQILSFGCNQYIDSNKTVHAELNVWKNLKPNFTKRKKEISIMVIRISSSGTIGNSKCCNYCTINMKKLSEKKGYKIKYVYYSDKNGNIIKSNLKKLHSNPHYSSLSKFLH